MKKILFVCVCLSLILLFSSCSENEDIQSDTTTEDLVTEENYSTSGTFSDTIKWRYDESNSSFLIYGTGKFERRGGVIPQNESHWSGIAETIRIEEGITDSDKFAFWLFDNVKTVCLPSSYVGYIPDMKKIEKYIVAENNPKYSSDENGVLFNADQTEIIRYPKGSPVEIYEIPEGVISIRSGAFKESKNLKTVIIPQSLDNVPKAAFEESSVYSNPKNWEDDIFYVDTCLVEVNWKTEAEHIAVKEGTRIIEAHAFALCKNIKSITIPDSVEIIGAQAFESCSSLESVYIGSGVKKIGGAPFIFDVEGKPCSKLKNIEVSKDNKNYISVDGVLFNKGMTELIQYPIGKNQKEYIISDSVTKIGYGAFCFCDELIKLTVGKGITVIDDCLLFGCDNIETVILPETLTKLDGGAFKYSGIKYIDIPDSVTFLGCEAMTACDRLETVDVGKGVSFIDGCAIGGQSLKKINVDRKNEHFSSRDGVLFNKDKTELLLYPANKSGETYRIPESVKTIKHAAIMQARNLKEIYVGSGVEKIEGYNFCESVEDPELDFRYETNYEIFFDGTEKQWNELLEDEYSAEYIDKSKINFLQ